jgi:hypothetical protein
MGARKYGVEGWGHSCNCAPLSTAGSLLKVLAPKITCLAQEDDRSSRFVDPILIVVLKFLRMKAFSIRGHSREIQEHRLTKTTVQVQCTVAL